jgi:hypothetical protein
LHSIVFEALHSCWKATASKGSPHIFSQCMVCLVL